MYIELEQMRYADKFSVFYKVQEEILDHGYLIPPMIIQPFIENAIIHGLRNKTVNDGMLHLSARLNNNYIVVQVEDNGIGRVKAGELKSLFQKQHQSKGMELLNKRFRLLNKEFGSSIQTEIIDVMNNNEVAGTLVTINVPLNYSGALQN